MLDSNFPIVAIFGRTNVGKSTLFNRLTEKERALVSDIEGTTRDYNVGEVEWREKKITLIDTGGIMEIKYLKETKKHKIKTNDIDAKVQKQARAILKKADLILFLVDSRSGPLPQDKEMSIILKRIIPAGKKIILVANKADSPGKRRAVSEFYKLALGEPIPVSAATGSGTGDLLDLIVKSVPFKKKKTEIETEKKDEIKACIVGKPNVGKSSLLNSILGEERVIVSPIPHTTREPQDTVINYKEKNIRLVDTAGISRKGLQRPYGKKEIKTALEKHGIAKSLGALGRADIALLVININEQITHQDAKIIEEIVERKKSMIIIANKWDLAPEKDTKKYTEYIYTKLPFAAWAPIQFVSALTGEKVKKIMDLIMEISEQRGKLITDSQTNTFMMKLVKMHRPSKGKGPKYPRIHKFFQTGTNPPRFEVKIGSQEDLHFSYIRFIENRLREKFGFLGTPISISVNKKRRVHGSHGDELKN